jgi:drug/metabolite transporter (DMT)-like permease
MSYLYVTISIVLTVYCQLILKWRIGSLEHLPESITGKAMTMGCLIFKDPFVASGFIATFLGALFWMIAMTRLSISVAYPFMSLAFVFVMIGAAIFLGESLSIQKITGTLLIVFGLIVISQ